MGHIIATEAVQACLDGLVEPVEIRDAGGRVLGHYTPNVSAEARRAHAEAVASFDLDEARRRSAAHVPGQGLTTEQVLERLKSLGSPG